MQATRLSSSNMDTTTPALASIGIGKDIFHLVGFDAAGKIALRRRIKRLALADTCKALPRRIVGMEACLSAHFVSRILRQLGHEPRIIPAIYVKPVVKGQNEPSRRPREDTGSAGPSGLPSRQVAAGIPPSVEVNGKEPSIFRKCLRSMAHTLSVGVLQSSDEHAKPVL